MSRDGGERKVVGHSGLDALESYGSSSFMLLRCLWVCLRLIKVILRGRHTQLRRRRPSGLNPCVNKCCT